MSIKRTKHIITNSIIVCFSLISCSNEKPIKMNINGFDENTMPICGYSGPSYYGWNKDLSTPKILTDTEVRTQFQYAKEAGFNILYSLYGTEKINSETDSDWKTKNGYIQKCLGFADEFDLKFAIQDKVISQYSVDSSQENINKYLEYIDRANYKKYSSFIGLIGKDEPSLKDFSDCARNEAFSAKALPGYLYQSNLFPCYASESQLGTSYKQYVNEYISTVKPKYVSYDFYPERGEFPSIRSDYFINLDIVSSKCRENNLPFWNFVLTSVHQNYRLPTAEEIYWQVNTSLAYGVKGIQYFNYRTPIEKDYIGKGGSVINEYGEKSSLFPYVKNINSYISSIDHILMNSIHQGIIYSGYTPAPISAQNKLETFNELTKVEVASGGTIIGCFQGDGVKNKIQQGSAWWFNDHFTGMTEQMRTLAASSNLGNFVGMLTDSRSFLSYTRHDYFRRIMCDLIGKWVDNGEYPDDWKYLEKIVKGISYNNAVNYFGFDLDQV